MLDKQGEFLGFYGRNDVNLTADVLYQAVLREFATEKQRAGMSNFIPVEFANFDIDKEGFIYTVTAYAENEQSFDMIRKLNPLGDNILTNLYRSWGDDRDQSGFYRTSYCDVVVDDSGFIYALDSYNGRIFQYDDEQEFIEEMNNELERTRSEIVGRLLADEEAKKAFAEAVGEYVLAFFNRQLLYKKREVNAIQQDIGNSQHSDSWNTGGWQVLFDI